jgi:2-isopropylmalate synthase
MGVANSIAAVKAGAGQIECTVNGLGERAGKAALEEVVMAMNTRKDVIKASCNIDTTQIARTSKLIYSIIGMTAPINKPIVGANAFAHESGIHQHGVLSERTTYEIMSPESVGIVSSKLVLGKHSGKHALKDRINKLGYEVTEEELGNILKSSKSFVTKRKMSMIMI